MASVSVPLAFAQKTPVPQGKKATMTKRPNTRPKSLGTPQGAARTPRHPLVLAGLRDLRSEKDRIRYRGRGCRADR
jgi:hypothetical protein